MPLATGSASSLFLQGERESQCEQALAALVFAAGELQQLRAAFSLQQLSRRAATTTNVGGVTPCFLAQASFWASVWQQQSRQQVSASWQPQGQFSQGNRSLAFFTERAGSGTPMEHIATVMQASQAASLCFRGTHASNRAGSGHGWMESIAGVKPPI